VAVAEAVTWLEMAGSKANTSLHLTLVGERCRSCSYEGGQVTQLREARMCGNIRSTTIIQPLYGPLWPSLYGLIWGVTSPSTVLSNCPFKGQTVWVPYRNTVAHIPVNTVTGAQPYHDPGCSKACQSNRKKNNKAIAYQTS